MSLYIRKQRTSKTSQREREREERQGQQHNMIHRNVKTIILRAWYNQTRTPQVFLRNCGSSIGGGCVGWVVGGGVSPGGGVFLQRALFCFAPLMQAIFDCIAAEPHDTSMFPAWKGARASWAWRSGISSISSIATGTAARPCARSIACKNQAGEHMDGGAEKWKDTRIQGNKVTHEHIH